MKAKNAGQVLAQRHKTLKSWSAISRELGNYNRGSLSAIARSNKEASPHLIDLINHAYGLHLPYPPLRVMLDTCRKCGQPHYRTLKRCPTLSQKYKPHPVMRLTEIEHRMTWIIGLLCDETPGSTYQV